MKKKLGIICYGQHTLDRYIEHINTIFNNSIDIIGQCLNQEAKDGLTEVSTILVQSYELLMTYEKFVKDSAKIIIANNTITKSGFNRLKNIPHGSKVIVVDESAELENKIIETLCQLGIRHINLLPSATFHNKKKIDQTLVVFGNISVDQKNNIINMGSKLLDINTILDICTQLELDNVLGQHDIENEYKEIKTVSAGISRMLWKVNRFNSQLDIVMENISEGIIAVNPKGKVFSYNEGAYEIIRLKQYEVINKNWFDIFPEIPFGYVLKTVKEVKEKLIKINNCYIDISVNPILHSGKFYGAVATLKRFSEEEKKHHKLRVQLIGKGHKAKYRFDDIVGKSESMKKVKNIAIRMSKSDSSILISGESGTGKELFAQAIHNNSTRKNFQFVAINCGALPESILESELFGYVEGAFTGARKGGKPGLFELAHKGTLFLDEIGEMSLVLQKRLLRVLQEREIMRIGGDTLIKVDIRIIAATNKDLKDLMSRGEFREDLYYRINVLPLKIPSLRNIRKDILPIFEKMKDEFGGKFSLSKEAEKGILEHNWSGNVRELRNYVEYFVNLNTLEISFDDLPLDIVENQGSKVCGYKENQIVNEFEKTAGLKLEKYLLVARILNDNYYKKSRIGRRKIYEISKKSNVLISELEIRKIIDDMRKLSLVDVHRGRGGTTITKEGIAMLKYYY